MQDVADEIASLSKQLADGDFSKLKDARAAVLGLKAPPPLVSAPLFNEPVSRYLTWGKHYMYYRSNWLISELHTSLAENKYVNLFIIASLNSPIWMFLVHESPC